MSEDRDREREESVDRMQAVFGIVLEAVAARVPLREDLSGYELSDHECGGVVYALAGYAMRGPLFESPGRFIRFEVRDHEDRLMPVEACPPADALTGRLLACAGNGDAEMAMTLWIAADEETAARAFLIIATLAGDRLREEIAEGES